MSALDALLLDGSYVLRSGLLPDIHNRTMHFLLASCCQMCYMIDRKRERHRSGYPSENQYLMLYSISRQLFAVVGGYFPNLVLIPSVPCSLLGIDFVAVSTPVLPPIDFLFLLCFHCHSHFPILHPQKSLHVIHSNSFSFMVSYSRK